MSRRRLLAALDSAARELGAGGVCPTCLGPSPEGKGFVLLEAGEELGACKDCGEPVDSEGKTVGRLTDGQVVLSLVILENGPAPPRERADAEPPHP